MKRISSRLANLLETEANAYARLYEILGEEQSALIEWAVGDLHGIVERKERHLEQIQRLEIKRMDYLATIQQDLEEMGFTLPRGQDSIKLSDIITMIGRAEATRLRELQEELARLVKDVTMTNYKNQVLLKRSLEIVNANLDIYTQSERLAETYGANGRFSPQVENHLIDGAI